jgi:hypothetical protein
MPDLKLQRWRQGMARASAAGGQSSDGVLCFWRRLRCARGREEETGARRQGLCFSFYTARRGRGTIGRWSSGGGGNHESLVVVEAFW